MGEHQLSSTKTVSLAKRRRKVPGVAGREGLVDGRVMSYQEGELGLMVMGAGEAS